MPSSRQVAVANGLHTCYIKSPTISKAHTSHMNQVPVELEINCTQADRGGTTESQEECKLQGQECNADSGMCSFVKLIS